MQPRPLNLQNVLSVSNIRRKLPAVRRRPARVRKKEKHIVTERKSAVRRLKDSAIRRKQENAARRLQRVIAVRNRTNYSL